MLLKLMGLAFFEFQYGEDIDATFLNERAGGIKQESLNQIRIVAA